MDMGNHSENLFKVLGDNQIVISFLFWKKKDEYRRRNIKYRSVIQNK
jgi:hypothetical protein